MPYLTPSTKPQFTHDCHACTFLGVVNKKDVYICGVGYAATVIARHGNAGEEYGSYPIAMLSIVRY